MVTGVTGSGKSSLIDGSVSGREGVVSVDQAPIRESRSNPAAYTRLLYPIRKAFAKANGVEPALFSSNSKGACPGCNGVGVIHTDLAMVAGVATTCEECEGKRFDTSVLEYHLGGLDMSEVLSMSVDEAAAFFSDGDAGTPAAHKILVRLADVGLGYLRIGQPYDTLRRREATLEAGHPNGRQRWRVRPLDRSAVPDRAHESEGLSGPDRECDGPWDPCVRGPVRGPGVPAVRASAVYEGEGPVDPGGAPHECSCPR